MDRLQKGLLRCSPFCLQGPDNLPHRGKRFFCAALYVGIEVASVAVKRIADAFDAQALHAAPFTGSGDSRQFHAAARAAGADAVLLIAAVLDDTTLKDLLDFAHSLGLAALVETHDAEEIARAVQSGARIVGVNCRNLRNFSTDVSLLETLVGQIPRPCLRIAESGMHTPDAIRRAKAAGADGFLVGTAFMRAPSPGAKLTEFLNN